MALPWCDFLQVWGGVPVRGWLCVLRRLWLRQFLRDGVREFLSPLRNSLCVNICVGFCVNL